MRSFRVRGVRQPEQMSYSAREGLSGDDLQPSAPALPLVARGINPVETSSSGTQHHDHPVRGRASAVQLIQPSGSVSDGNSLTWGDGSGSTRFPPRHRDPGRIGAANTGKDGQPSLSRSATNARMDGT